jgi:hypothetical protein
MGGFGSGRWQDGKALTTERMQLDLRKMQRPAKSGGTHFQSWTNGASTWLTFRPSTVDVETRLPGQPTNRHSIHLVTTPLNYGGHRVWWKCPCCLARVGVLYWEGWRWQCRKCARLVHESTRQTEDTLAYKRVNKIREKLGWGGGLCSPMGGRPKGMHWRTYARLIQQLNDASLAAAGASADRIDMLTERLLKTRIFK